MARKHSFDDDSSFFSYNGIAAPPPVEVDLSSDDSYEGVIENTKTLSLIPPVRSSVTLCMQPSTPILGERHYPRLWGQRAKFEDLSIERCKAYEQSKHMARTPDSHRKTVSKLIGELYELQDKKIKKLANKKLAEKKIMEQVQHAVTLR